MARVPPAYRKSVRPVTALHGAGLDHMLARLADRSVDWPTLQKELEALGFRNPFRPAPVRAAEPDPAAGREANLNSCGTPLVVRLVHPVAGVVILGLGALDSHVAVKSTKSKDRRVVPLIPELVEDVVGQHPAGRA